MLSNLTQINGFVYFHVNTIGLIMNKTFLAYLLFASTSAFSMGNNPNNVQMPQGPQLPQYPQWNQQPQQPQQPQKNKITTLLINNLFVEIAYSFSICFLSTSGLAHVPVT